MVRSYLFKDRIRRVGLLSVSFISLTLIYTLTAYADLSHTSIERDPAVLNLQGKQLRPTADGVAARFFLTAKEKQEADEAAKTKSPTSIPASITKLALQVGKGLTPQKLFDAVTKLKTADNVAKIQVASKELSDLLGKDSVKLFEREGRTDFDLMMEALTLKTDGSPTDSLDPDRVRSLRALLAGLTPDASGAPPTGEKGKEAAKGKEDQSAAPPTGPGGPGGGTDDKGKTPGDEPVVTPTEVPVADLPPQQINNPNADVRDVNNDLNNNALDDLLNELNNGKKRGRGRNNNKADVDKNDNDKNNGEQAQQGGGAPSGGAPSIQPAKLDLKQPDIPKPGAAPEMTLPSPVADVNLSGDLVNKLSGGDIGKGKTYDGDKFADILNAYKGLNETALATILQIGLKQNAMISNANARRDGQLNTSGSTGETNASRLANGSFGGGGRGGPRGKSALNLPMTSRTRSPLRGPTQIVGLPQAPGSRSNRQFSERPTGRSVASRPR